LKAFPHQYYMINQHTKEAIITSIQQTEDDDFNIFGAQVLEDIDRFNIKPNRKQIIGWFMVVILLDELLSRMLGQQLSISMMMVLMSKVSKFFPSISALP